MLFLTKLSVMGLLPNRPLRAWANGTTTPSAYGWSTYCQAIRFMGWTLGVWGRDPSGYRLYTVISYPDMHTLRAPLIGVTSACKRYNPLILPFFDESIFYPEKLPSYIDLLPPEMRSRASLHLNAWHKDIYHD